MSNPSNHKSLEFAIFATKRVIIVAAIIIMAFWAFNYKSDHKESEIQDKGDDSVLATGKDSQSHTDGDHSHAGSTEEVHAEKSNEHKASSHDSTADTDRQVLKHDQSDKHPQAPSSGHGEAKDSHSDKAPQDRHSQSRPHEPAKSAHQAKHSTPGVAFVEAIIKPLGNELNERFWGWRPNDIINFSDNVNNYQLGVLEVTRKTVIQLADGISRTGHTDSFNPHVENAQNWLMVKATRYWFPSPESKYKESLKELDAYKQQLIKERASFYTRTDNLIPLLAAYENLLGSCDENLVKKKNEDGSEVSVFQADDYFFYAKGVASAMVPVLEAIHQDFHQTIENRNAGGLLHHALESCRQAASLDPLFITDGDLDGILANHRANMAAPISHARFYLGQLIKTLST